MTATVTERPRVKQRACPTCGGDRRARPRVNCQSPDRHKIKVSDLPAWPCCGGRGEHAKKCSNHPDYEPEPDELIPPEWCRAKHPLHPARCVRGFSHEGPHRLANGATWRT